LSRFGFALLLGLAASGGAFAETQNVVINNDKEADRLLNVRDGAPKAVPVAAQSPSAQWRLGTTGEAALLRLLNVGSGLYLQTDRGRLIVGPIEAAAQKADWTLEIVPGHAATRIHNRVGGYLHTNDGPLVVGDASPKLDASYWTIVPIAGDTDKLSLGPAGPGPDAAPVGPAPSSTDAVPAGPGDTTLPVPVVVPVPGGNRPPIHIPTCPAGKHLSNGHCCPNLEVWNAASHTCRVIPIHY